MKRQFKELNARLDRALAFSRARNGDGEFAPQETEGPDPNAMSKAYGAPEQRVSGAGVAAGVGGLTAAALLARRLRGKMRAV